MDRGAWRATVHGVAQSETTEATRQEQDREPARAQRDCLLSAALGGQDGAAAQKAVWQFLITLPLTLLPFLGIYPRETKIYFHTKTGT